MQQLHRQRQLPGHDDSFSGSFINWSVSWRSPSKKNIETEHTVAAKQDHIILFQMGAKGKGFYPYWWFMVLPGISRQIFWIVLGFCWALLIAEGADDCSKTISHIFKYVLAKTKSEFWGWYLYANHLNGSFGSFQVSFSIKLSFLNVRIFHKRWPEQYIGRSGVVRGD